MWFARTLVVLAGAALPLVWAQSTPSASLDGLLPSCALECLKSEIRKSPCTLSNTTCICADEALYAVVESCALASCTVKQSLYSKGIKDKVCDAPVRDKSQEYNIVSITLGSFTAAVVLLRTSYKALVVGQLDADDWVMVATFLIGVPCTVINSVGFVANGIGRDVWTLPAHQITEFGRWFYIAEVLYFVQITLLKVSVLLFYLKVFTRTPLVPVLWGTVVFNALCGVVFAAVSIFQCTPIQYYWTRWDEEQSGRCIDVNALAWGNAGVSIAMDVWILALPLSQVAKLKLHWKKKLGVAVMFGVGIFVTIVSILRLESLLTFATSLNPTWDNFDVGQWSTIEINVGIVCACLPTIRMILVRFFPRFLGSTASASRGDPSAVRTGHYGRHSTLPRDRNWTVETKNRSVNRDSQWDAENGTQKGIMCSKAFAVDYQDDASLVAMRDLSRPESLHSKSPSQASARSLESVPSFLARNG